MVRSVRRDTQRRPQEHLNGGCRHASAWVQRRFGILLLGSQDKTGWATETAHDAGLLDEHRGWAMKTLAALTAVALVAMGTFGAPEAQARGQGGALVAGVIGGLAAGALLGGAISEARDAPAYGDGYGRPEPRYVDDDAGPVLPYRRAPVIGEYAYDAVSVYRSPRAAIRPYGEGFGGYTYRRAGYGYRPDCDRAYGPRGW